MSQQAEALKEFKRIPILSALTDDEIFDFIRLCKVQRLAKGAPLFEQGETGRSMFIIGEGHIDVFLERETGREHIAEFGPLDVLGELSLLDPQERSATAIARDEVMLYEVLGDDFEGMLRMYHPAAFKIVRGVSRLICRRIRSVNTRIEAEFAGQPPPPPHTGEYEHVRESAQYPRVDSRTAPHPQVRTGPRVAVGPGKPERPGTTNMFRRVLSKLWSPDDE